MADDDDRLAGADREVDVGQRPVRPRRAARVHVADAVERDERRARADAAGRPAPRALTVSSVRRRAGASTTRPPASVIVRSAAAASAARCVTCTTPRPSSCARSWNSVDELRPAGRRRPSRSTRRRSAAWGRARARPRSRVVAARRPTSVDVSRSARSRSPTRSRNASTSTRSGCGMPHTTSSRTRTPSTCASGRCDDDRGPADAPEPDRARSRDLAAGRRAPAGEQPGQRRLARTVRADDRDELGRVARRASRRRARRRSRSGSGNARRAVATGSGSGATSASTAGFGDRRRSTTASPNASRTRRSAGVESPCASQMPNQRSKNSVSGTLSHQSRRPT